MPPATRVPIHLYGGPLDGMGAVTITRPAGHSMPDELPSNPQYRLRGIDDTDPWGVRWVYEWTAEHTGHRRACTAQVDGKTCARPGCPNLRKRAGS